MAKENLGEKVKALRNLKGFSQEELANKSGLSLRTIQRVEKGETEPTGDTLNKIATVFNLSPEELIITNNNEDELKKTIKAKHEYLHIFDDKLMISKTPQFDDSVGDYNKYLNNLFKTLIVFLIGVPIFTIAATILYDIRPDLSFQAGSFAFFFLIMAIYAMLFTSGTPLIYKNQIEKITIEYTVFGYSIVIKYRDMGILKKRGIMVDKDKLDSTKKLLLEEMIFKNTDLRTDRRSFMIPIISCIIFIGMNHLETSFSKTIWGQGLIFFVLSLYLLLLITRGIFQSYKWKKENKKLLIIPE